MIQHKLVVESAKLEGCQPSPRFPDWRLGRGHGRWPRGPSLHAAGEEAKAETPSSAPMAEAWWPLPLGADLESAFPPPCLGREPLRSFQPGPSLAPYLMTSLT